MKNKTWLIVTVCMLLASAVILTGCMYAIAQQEEPSKPYEMGEAVSLVPEDAPTPQAEMEAKFAVYNHAAEVGEEQVLHLFSASQAEEQWTKRQNGEDFRLTYDEIIFLINDSLRLYNTYDEIYLTDALKNGILITSMSQNHHIIHSNRGVCSGLSYEEEQKAYEQMMMDVATIATYRIAMLDSRMRQIGVTSVPYSGWYGSHNVYSIGGQEIYEGQWLPGFPAPTSFACWAMLLTEEPITDEDAYRDGLRAYFSGGLSQTESDAVAEYPPMLLFGFWKYAIQKVNSPAAFKNIVGRCETLFPTAELEEAKPVWELEASCLKPGESARLYAINTDKMVRMSQIGSFDEAAHWTYEQLMGDLQAVIDRYQEADVSYTPEELGGQFLEVYLGNGTSIIISDGSTSAEYGFACIVQTQTDGAYEELSFRPCLPRELLQWIHMRTFRDANGIVYFHAFDLGTMPTLMLRGDGTGYVHGAMHMSYTHGVRYTLEEDRLVLYVLDENGTEIFRQVYYHQGYAYVYSAEESMCEGVYDFPDGTVFYPSFLDLRGDIGLA